jgi:hypothetical protein
MPERKWKLDEGPFGQYLLICEDALIKTIGVDLATARKVAAHQEMYEALEAVQNQISDGRHLGPSVVKLVCSALKLADTGKE